jgi:hypothetical protein
MSDNIIIDVLGNSEADSQTEQRATEGTDLKARLFSWRVRLERRLGVVEA